MTVMEITVYLSAKSDIENLYITPPPQIKTTKQHPLPKRKTNKQTNKINIFFSSDMTKIVLLNERERERERERDSKYQNNALEWHIK